MFVSSTISGEEAGNILSSKKSFFPFRIKRSHLFPLKMELIHLPFYLFDVFVEEEGKKQKETLAVDGLVGHAVFFTKEILRFEKNASNVFSEFELSPSEAQRIAFNEYRGLLLEHGLRTRRFPKAEEISDGRKIFYPFWLGYFKKRKGYDFKALDAVSGEIQGIKMRKLFLKAFREMN